MKRHIILSLLLFLSISAVSYAEGGYPKQEFRIGWGDSMFAKAAFYNTQTKTDHRYTGHFFIEYDRYLKDWLSIGLNADMEHVSWKESGIGQHFNNWTFLPSVKFTYFRKGLVTMYSGVGVGLTINSGSEVDYKGRTTICSPCLGITAYGVSVGNEKLFGAFEIGGLNSFNNFQQIFMLGSRLFSFSVGCRL